MYIQMLRKLWHQRSNTGTNTYGSMCTARTTPLREIRWLLCAIKISKCVGFHVYQRNSGFVQFWLCKCSAAHDVYAIELECIRDVGSDITLRCDIRCSARMWWVTATVTYCHCEQCSPDRVPCCSVKSSSWFWLSTHSRIVKGIPLRIYLSIHQYQHWDSVVRVLRVDELWNVLKRTKRMWIVTLKTITLSTYLFCLFHHDYSLKLKHTGTGLTGVAVDIALLLRSMSIVSWIQWVLSSLSGVLEIWITGFEERISRKSHVTISNLLWKSILVLQLGSHTGSSGNVEEAKALCLADTSWNFVQNFSRWWSDCRQITRRSHTYHSLIPKYNITRKSTLECTLDYDEYLTRASRSNTGTPGLHCPSMSKNADTICATSFTEPRLSVGSTSYVRDSSGMKDTSNSQSSSSSSVRQDLFDLRTKRTTSLQRLDTGSDDTRWWTMGVFVLESFDLDRVNWSECKN